MKAKARIIIMSHLSDAQHLTESNTKEANLRINFAKYLLLKFPNTDLEIDPEAEWEQFENTHPQFFK
jgi:hypothetical protein